MDTSVARDTPLDLNGSSVTLSDNLKVIRRVVESLNIRADHYLDLGCGNGSLTKYIANLVRSSRVVGIDINPLALEKAKEAGIEVYRIDLNNEPLPFAGESFDLITAFELIEHLWNKDFFLKEVFRVLRKGGFFILSTPNLASWVNRILLLFGYLPLHYDISFEYELQRRPFQKTRMLYGHVNLYTLPALLNHLKAVGFEIISSKGLISSWCFKNKLILIVSKVLSMKTSLAPIILVVARKP
jgi:SAM-dependent methyltransferase